MMIVVENVPGCGQRGREATIKGRKSYGRGEREGREGGRNDHSWFDVIESLSFELPISSVISD